MINSTVIRIGYCAHCGWFNQQTLRARTRPENRCSKCGKGLRGPGGGGLGDCSINVKIPIRRYSQDRLREIYLEDGGWIPEVVEEVQEE